MEIGIACLWIMIGGVCGYLLRMIDEVRGKYKDNEIRGTIKKDKKNYYLKINGLKPTKIKIVKGDD